MSAFAEQYLGGGNCVGQGNYLTESILPLVYSNPNTNGLEFTLGTYIGHFPGSVLPRMNYTDSVDILGPVTCETVNKSSPCKLDWALAYANHLTAKHGTDSRWKSREKLETRHCS